MAVSVAEMRASLSSVSQRIGHALCQVDERAGVQLAAGARPGHVRPSGQALGALWADSTAGIPAGPGEGGLWSLAV